MHRNGSATRPVIFRQKVAPGESVHLESTLEGNGHISELIITFATGENGTLRVKPYILLNGNIRQDLLNYGGDEHFISGDSISLKLPCYQPVERHAKLCVDAENVGEGESMVSVDVIIAYNDFAVAQTVIGSY